MTTQTKPAVTLTSRMRLVLKRLAMPDAQITEDWDSSTHKSRYELSWRGDGGIHACDVTKRLIDALLQAGRIEEERQPRYDKRGRFITSESVYTLVPTAA